VDVAAPGNDVDDRSPASVFPARRRPASSLAPLEKNSGAPHSSVSTCASWWQMTLWYDWQSAASASELAAVPLKTK
jgi:hypothetical protein